MQKTAELAPLIKDFLILSSPVKKTTAENHECPWWSEHSLWPRGYLSKFRGQGIDENPCRWQQRSTPPDLQWEWVLWGESDMGMKKYCITVWVWILNDYILAMSNKFDILNVYLSILRQPELLKHKHDDSSCALLHVRTWHLNTSDKAGKKT